MLPVFAIVVLCLMLVSCGDDDPVGPDPDTTRPTITEVSPVDGAQLIARDAVVTATFSEDMRVSTIDSAAFEITPDVPGSVSYDNRVMTFTPSQLLDSNITYTATVTTAVKDTAGNALASDFFWEFSTSTVAMISPADGAVVGDLVLIQVGDGSSGVIDHAEFFIDGSLATTVSAPPYLHLWNAAGEDLGSEHEIIASAYDSTGATILSDTVTVHYLWELLIADDSLEFDAGSGLIVARDLKNIYARSTSTQLQFRVETNRGWGDYDDPNEGIDVVLFMDTDQNGATGRDRVESVDTYMLNGIGAEARVIVGNNGNDLWTYSTSWISRGGANLLNIVDSSNFFEVGVNLSRLGNPTALDIVAANFTYSTNGMSSAYLWDWAPNQGEGFATYVIDNSYQAAPARPNAKSSNRVAKAAGSKANPFD